MERLTKRKSTAFNTFKLNTNVRREDADTKLGQIEDIEEKLGIDLNVLFEAIKNGIYVKPKYDRIFHNTFIAITRDLNGEYYFYEEETENIYLKDYGKTWALTKEELEK